MLLSPVRRLLSSASLQEPSAPPLILLLDLDETLVRPKIQKVHAKRNLSTTDYKLMIDGEIECSLSLRPGVNEFFDWIRARKASGHIAGPWLFGQGAINYIKPVLHQIDPKKDIFGDRILAKESCMRLEHNWPWVLKSFHAVPAGDDEMCGPKDFPRIVLVDNNVMSCMLHPENTLLVRDWLADGAADTELARVSATLDAIIAADAADGATGDYASHLVKATPRFQEFKALTGDLYSQLQEPPDPQMPWKRALIALWEDACNAKRMLLGLGPKEV